MLHISGKTQVCANLKLIFVSLLCATLQIVDEIVQKKNSRRLVLDNCCLLCARGYLAGFFWQSTISWKNLHPTRTHLGTTIRADFKRAEGLLVSR